MAEAVLEKEVCQNCGADIREGTTFCYSCGTRVVDEGKPEVEAVEQIEQPVAEETAFEKRARSAEQRKRSRIRQRKVVEYEWEPYNDSRWLVVAAVLIFLVVLVVVIAALWK